MDEMWSFVKSKSNQRWLWHAIDHITGKVLAYTLGGIQIKYFWNSKAFLNLLVSINFSQIIGAYQRHITPEQHEVGKRNTQKIERKHLTLRTRIKRLARKTICFSKLTQMHDIVIGLFINRYEFGKII